MPNETHSFKFNSEHLHICENQLLARLTQLECEQH